MKPITILSTALLLLVAAPAFADEPPPSGSEVPPANDPPAGTKRDGVRVRGGLSAAGGFVYVSSSRGSAIAPVVGLSGRIGVQINHLFSVYYQNMAAVLVQGGGTAIFDYNSLLANVTAAHVFDFGLGPSADVVSISAGSSSGTAVIFGLHGRLAFNIGGASGPGPRRSGFSVGLDVHPSFGPGGVLVATTGGLGYEWF